MKVLYSFSYNPNLPGVNNKILAKISRLKQLGLELKILCYTSEPFLSDLSGFDVIYVKPLKATKLPAIFNLKYLNFLSQLIENRKTNHFVGKILASTEFDFFVLRYGMGNYFSYNLTKKFKHKFVFEHNTNEIEQYKLKYKNPISSHSWITYNYFSEKIFGPKLLKYSAGVIGVTHEITDYEVSRISRKRLLPLSTTISNGINVDDYNINYPKSYSNELNMVMILGVNAEWHGVSRIIDGLNNYKGDKNVALYIIGNINEIECSRAIYKGYMNFEEMNNFFENENIHLAIASLALHRINIREASVLKAREYMARGIPFVYSYIDTDIDTEKNELLNQFFLKINADESPLDINLIIDFYDRVSQIDNYPKQIAQYAKQKVDMTVKMQQYKDFLNEINLEKTSILE